MKLALAFLFLAAFLLPASESDPGASKGCCEPGPVTVAVIAPPPPIVIHPTRPADEDLEPQDEPQKDYEARKKEDDGIITGSVKFSGTAPALPAINFSGDKTCHELHKDAPMKLQTVIVNDNKTLRNTFVYISAGAKAWKCKVPAEAASIDQKGCVYHPHVFGMMVGQDLDIKNSDANLLHNIHAVPKKNLEFNFGQPGVMVDKLTATSKNKTFMEPEVMVRVKCDVHDWMGAWVGVRPNPFFSVTGEDGTFKIAGVPPGKYTLTAWHEFYGNLDAKPKKTEPLKSAELTVEPGKTVTFDFDFK